MKNKLKLSEKDFQAQIVSLAKLYGWAVHAERPAMMQSGNWVTPIQGDAGWPDLVLVKGNRILFWEVKTDKGVLSSAQWDWIARLQQVAQAEVVQPHQWQYIQDILTR